MTRTTFIAASLAVILPAVSAQAQAPRTFVSAAGNDSNPCSFAAPCRHFQAAVTATTVGGEVDALDPAGYGPITISQAITIEGQGWSYIAPPAGGNAITINAVSGNVVIHGVSLDGAGITGGTNGIVFNSGSGLTVANCVVQNFTGSGASGNGILMRPSSGAVNFIIANSVIVNNAYDGFGYQPTQFSFVTANGVIDHVVATSNQYGIAIDTSNGGGATTVAIANGIASNNSSVGISLLTGSTSLAVSIDNTAATGNFDGIQAFGTVNVLLSRSVIQGNETGISNLTSPNTFYTYGNNLIDLNSSNISSPLNATVTLR